MGDRQQLDQSPPHDQQQLQSPPKDDMIACVMALEAALLPCLPARELQAIDRSAHPSHQSKSIISVVLSICNLGHFFIFFVHILSHTWIVLGICFKS